MFHISRENLMPTMNPLMLSKCEREFVSRCASQKRLRSSTFLTYNMNMGAAVRQYDDLM
jgi:hypothetical protein